MISCLRGAGVEVVERHEAVWEGTPARLVARADRRATARARGDAAALRRTSRALRRGDRRLPRPLRPACGATDRARAAGDLQPARLASRHTRRGSRPLRAGLARGRRARARRPARAPARRPRRRRHRAERTPPRRARRARRERVEVCFVGAEERALPARRQPARAFTHALFVGKLIPLHGLETILEAARLAPELPFRIVGSGQLDALLGERPPNVEWVPWVEYERLAGGAPRAGARSGSSAAPRRPAA